MKTQEERRLAARERRRSRFRAVAVRVGSEFHYVILKGGGGGAEVRIAIRRIFSDRPSRPRGRRKLDRRERR